MLVLFIANFEVAWIFFAFLFVALFGGAFVLDRPYIIAAGFLLVSLIVSGIGLSAMRRSWSIRTWPTAPGFITDSQICTKSVNRGLVYWGPCIEYSYQIEGQTFEGNSRDTEEFALRFWIVISDAYQEDRKVVVYYDPNNPGISRLTKSIPLPDWITTIVGGSMAVLSAFTFFWLLIRRKSTSQILTSDPSLH